MTNLDEYLEIRDAIIRPALEELKEEYEAQGYQCHIATQRPQTVRSRAIISQRGSSPGRTPAGAISFSRRRPDNVKGTVSIFLSDGGWVIFNKLNVLYSSRLHLDEITTDRVKEKIREALG